MSDEFEIPDEDKYGWYHPLVDIHHEDTYTISREDMGLDQILGRHYGFRGPAVTQSLIACLRDLPADHSVDKEGFCDCTVGEHSFENRTEEEWFGDIPPDPIKPYYWL